MGTKIKDEFSTHDAGEKRMKIKASPKQLDRLITFVERDAFAHPYYDDAFDQLLYELHAVYFDHETDSHSIMIMLIDNLAADFFAYVDRFDPDRRDDLIDRYLDSASKSVRASLQFAFNEGHFDYMLD